MIPCRNRTEWTKGICPIWSSGRRFSPSLPGNSYLKLGSKSDPRAEISGNIVRYDALAPRSEVLRSFSCFYANALMALRALLRIQFSLQAFVFSRRLLLKLQEVLSVEGMFSCDVFAPNKSKV